VGSGKNDLRGFELKQYLSSQDALYHIMFSAIMLHWNLYAPRVGDKETSTITLERWLEINRGLEADGSDVPEHVLSQCYFSICSGFVPQLAIRSAPGPARVHHPIRSLGTGVFGSSRTSIVSGAASMEGWAFFVGRSLAKWVGTPKSAHMSNIFSEAVKASQVVHQRSWDSHGRDRVWVSLCYALLLFSSAPGANEAPYAFVDIRNCRPRRGAGASLLISQAVASEEAGGVQEDSLEEQPLSIIFLLLDGRWQEFSVPRLELELLEEDDVDLWQHLISRQAQGDFTASKCTVPVNAGDGSKQASTKFAKEPVVWY